MSNEPNLPAGLLDLNPIKPILEGIEWLCTFSARDVQEVKDEWQELLGHLSKGIVSLWKITREVARLSDQDFQAGFPKLYEYFKDAYYDPQAFAAVRIHCGNLDKSLKDLRFKLSVVLRTDLGKWKDARESLRIGLLEDRNYEQEYRRNFELLNTRLNEINSVLNENKPGEALEKYKALRKQLSGDLDYLNAHVQKIREADSQFRSITG